MNRKSEFRALITHALFSGDLRRLFLYTAGRTMAPGGGRGSGRGSAPKDETVIMGGQTLRRVMDESTRQWVYRPVDEASGNVITKEAFEARRLAERRLRAEADPRKQAEREKRWLAQQRGEIRNARVEESRAMRRDEHARKLESGLVERRRPRRREIARVPEPELLLELREEMRVALANGLDKKNPGRFAFVKTALDAEEAKHDAAVKSAREKAYAQERKRRGVRGAHDFDQDLSSSDGDESEDAIIVRGSLADLDDPDYRRGPAVMRAAATDGASKPTRSVRGARDSGGRRRRGRRRETREGRPRGRSRRWTRRRPRGWSWGRRRRRCEGSRGGVEGGEAEGGARGKRRRRRGARRRDGVGGRPRSGEGDRGWRGGFGSRRGRAGGRGGGRGRRGGGRGRGRGPPSQPLFEP